jgi:O-antigen/teichoic acid export membrane protein
MGVIAKQSVRGTIVTYLGIGVGFVTTFFVLTRFLTTEEIGLARVLIDAATLFIGLAQLGTTSSVIRFYPYFHEKENETHGFFFWTVAVPLIGFVIFGILYCVCHVPLAAWFGEKSPLFVDYYYYVIPLAFFMLYQLVFETNANVLMQIVMPKAVRELYVRVGLLVVYLLYAFRVLSLDGLVVGICINYAFAAFINLAYLISLRKISWQVDWRFLKDNKVLVRRYLTYTGFLIVSALATTVAPLLSSFFITAKMGLDYTGVFAIATYMAALVGVPYRSLTAIASPQLAKAIKEQNRDECSRLIQQVTGTMLLVGGFILLAIWVNIDLIFTVLPNGQTYAVARYVVLLLGVSQLILATFTICLTALNYSRYYAFSLLLSLILTGSALLLNNLLIPLYGINGAALSNLISYALYGILTVAALVPLCRLKIVNRQWGYTLLLLTAVFGLNTLWNCYIPAVNVWVDSLLRTVVLLGGGFWIAYRGKLSPEINRFMDTYILKRLL